MFSIMMFLLDCFVNYFLYFLESDKTDALSFFLPRMIALLLLRKVTIYGYTQGCVFNHSIKPFILWNSACVWDWYFRLILFLWHVQQLHSSHSYAFPFSTFLLKLLIELICILPSEVIQEIFVECFNKWIRT